MSLTSLLENKNVLTLSFVGQGLVLCAVETKQQPSRRLFHKNLPSWKGSTKPLGEGGFSKSFGGRDILRDSPFPEGTCHCISSGKQYSQKALGEGIFYSSIKREYPFPQGFC